MKKLISRRFLTFFCKAQKKEGEAKRMTQAYAELRCQSKDILKDVLGMCGFSLDLKDALFEILMSVPASITPYGDAMEFIIAAKKRHLKLGLLTNGVVAVQKNKVNALSISAYFDAILYARQFGRDLEKPHVRAFEEIVRMLSVPAKELIFVGDNPGTDFGGAKEIHGFTARIKRGVFKNVPRNAAIDMEIADMKDLDALL